MAQRSHPIDSTTRRPRLWLAACEGVRLPAPRADIAPIDRPELPLEIEFEGLTLQEQRAALAAFPGGRRFILVTDGHDR
jgi:hypothetical protein